MISYSLYYFSFLSSIRFFFFFSCFFSATRVYPLLSPSSPFFLYFFFFFYLIPEPLSLSLVLSQTLSFSTFFFYLIPVHSLVLSVIRNGERGREWRNKREILLTPPLIEGHRLAENRHSLCQATPFAPPPLIFLPNTASPDGSDGLCLFFFFLFAFIVMIWLILRLCFWVCILIMLEFRDVWEKWLLCL